MDILLVLWYNIDDLLYIVWNEYFGVEWFPGTQIKVVPLKARQNICKQ